MCKYALTAFGNTGWFNQGKNRMPVFRMCVSKKVNVMNFIISYLMSVLTKEKQSIYMMLTEIDLKFENLTSTDQHFPGYEWIWGIWGTELTSCDTAMDFSFHTSISMYYPFRSSLLFSLPPMLSNDSSASPKYRSGKELDNRYKYFDTYIGIKHYNLYLYIGLMWGHERESVH